MSYVDAIVTVGVTLVTQPKPVEELRGLVYGMAVTEDYVPASERVWYRRPAVLAVAILTLTTALSIAFI